MQGRFSMKARKAKIERTTKETQISISIDLDGTGESSIDTGIGFFDHMLTALARHGLFDLTIAAKGDLEIDPHHTVEDVGIVLGRCPPILIHKTPDKYRERKKGRYAATTIPPIPPHDVVYYN
jgi:imidazoleglycerol phosphate dehydratase HisB